jgi:hypothetical protein
MAAIISSTFRSQNSQAFIDDIKGDRSNVYIGLGKSSVWADASTGVNSVTDLVDVPEPEDTLDAINEARQQLIGLKLITDSDISHVVPRYDWVDGATFVPWDSTDPAIYDKAFYCLTSEFKVYKCIIAGGSGVTDVPTHVDAEIRKTDDDYYWKYMYTIIASDAEKFLTNSYMPVKTLTESTNGVVETSMGGNGTTFTIKNENPFIMVGQTLDNTTNDARDPSDATTVVTAVSGKTITVSANVNFNANDVIKFGAFLSEDPLQSQQTSQANSRALATAQGIERIKVTNGGAGYTNAANIAITVTGDGTGFTINGGSAGVSSNFVDTGAGQLLDIIVKDASSGTDNQGTNFSVAQATTTGGGSGGNATTLATLVPIISPRGRPGFSVDHAEGGHGCDPVFELGGFYVGLNVQISGTTDTAIANTQDFRQIMLLKNPLDATGQIPTAPVSALNALNYFTAESGYSALTSLATSAQSNDLVMEQSNGFKAYVVNVDTTSNRRIYYFQNDLTGYVSPSASAQTDFKINGNIQSGLVLSGANTTNVAQGPDFKAGSGEVLFLENRNPIQRSTSQIEDIKLIIEF